MCWKSCQWQRQDGPASLVADVTDDVRSTATMIVDRIPTWQEMRVPQSAARPTPTNTGHQSSHHNQVEPVKHHTNVARTHDRMLDVFR